MVVNVETEPGFSAGAPQRLYSGRFGRDLGGVDLGVTNYDVSLDGQRFLMVVPTAPPDRLHVLLDWRAALR